MTKEGHAHDNQTPFFIEDGANPIFTSGSNSIQMLRYGQNFDYEENAFATQANLVGHFNTGELKHTLLTGAEFYRFNSYYSLGLGVPSSAIDLFDPVHPGVSFGTPITQAYKITGTSYHFGAYVQDQIELPFHLHVMGVARYQDYTRLYRNPDFRADGSLGLTSDPNLNPTRVTPRVGVLWRPVEWFSAYGNYSEGFGPNEALIWPNLPPPPSDARQFEFGVKMELFEGRLRMSADYFEVAKTNMPTGDPAHPGYSIVIGEVTTKGPEIDITGEIMPGWNVILSYANMEARTTKSNDGDIGNRFPNQPRNVASLWSTYEVQDGDLRGLRFGGGVKYQDEQPMINFSGVKSPWPSLPPVATIDLMAGYKFEIEGAKVNAQINVTNLLDHHYYTIGQVTGYRPGWSFQYTNRAEPQKFMGSVSVAF
jgi:iron complex outermembrane receptor protein